MGESVWMFEALRSGACVLIKVLGVTYPYHTQTVIPKPRATTTTSTSRFSSDRIVSILATQEQKLKFLPSKLIHQ